MAQSSTATSGQLAGLNDRFQTGLAQIQKYLGSTSFNNFNLQAATPAAIGDLHRRRSPFSDYTYSTKQLVTNSNLNNAMPGLSASQSFTIGIKKGGTTTNVPIDLQPGAGHAEPHQHRHYINSQLSAGRLFHPLPEDRDRRHHHLATPTPPMACRSRPAAPRQVSLSAASTPALYMAGNSGTATETSTVTNTDTNDQPTPRRPTRPAA